MWEEEEEMRGGCSDAPGPQSSRVESSQVKSSQVKSQGAGPISLTIDIEERASGGISYLLPTTYYLPPTTYHLLPTTYLLSAAAASFSASVSAAPWTGPCACTTLRASLVVSACCEARASSSPEGAEMVSLEMCWMWPTQTPP